MQVKGRTSLTKQEEILSPDFGIKEVQLTLSCHLPCCILVILQILKGRKLHGISEILITKVLNSLLYTEFVETEPTLLFVMGSE